MLLAFYTASVLIPIIIMIFLVIRIVRNRATDVLLCLECERCMGACPVLLKKNNTFPGPVHIMIEAKTLVDPDKLDKDFSLCIDCGLCVKACPRGLSPQKVLEQLKKNNEV